MFGNDRRRIQGFVARTKSGGTESSMVENMILKMCAASFTDEEKKHGCLLSMDAAWTYVNNVKVCCSCGALGCNGCFK